MHPYQDSLSNQTWLALAIGNSRLHWAMFVDGVLQETWEEPHQDALDFRVFQKFGSLLPSIWIASVVPDQARLWADYSKTRFLSLNDVPLQRLYPTLGIDRALALWGAIATGGSPALVIDCGTALTFTGADQDQCLVGGAILPGLRLQFEALGQKTALLPTLTHSSTHPFPPRWARNTEDAIASGILYTVTAGIQAFVQNWWQQFPGSKVVMTGGDSDRLHQCLQQQCPGFAAQIILDNLLIFKGIRAIRFISI